MNHKSIKGNKQRVSCYLALYERSEGIPDTENRRKISGLLVTVPGAALRMR
jgi:hypothetical protein